MHIVQILTDVFCGAYISAWCGVGFKSETERRDFERTETKATATALSVVREVVSCWRWCMTYNFGCRNTHGESSFDVLLTEAMVKRVYHGAAWRSVVLLLTATAAVGVSSSVQPLCWTETGKSNKKPIQEYIALYVVCCLVCCILSCIHCWLNLFLFLFLEWKLFSLSCLNGDA